MPRPIEEPVVTEGDGLHRDYTTTHPAYGQISASRVSGGAMLYGSDFQHHNYISITVSRSEQIRNLSHDHHFSKNELIELNMSEAQWATFVSSLNVGGVVPCTLTAINRQMIPGLPIPTPQKAKFNKEVADAAKEGLTWLKTIRDSVDDMKLSQKAKEELIRNLDMVSRSFTSSIPFVLDRFGEHMEATVEKAKIEINAYSTQMVMQTGLAALKGESTNLLTYE